MEDGYIQNLGASVYSLWFWALLIVLILIGTRLETRGHPGAMGQAILVYVVLSGVVAILLW